MSYIKQRPCERRLLAIFVACWIGIVASGSLVGCGPPPPQLGNQQGPGKRHQELALTPKQEIEVGRKAYQEILAEARGHVLPAEHPDVRRVRAITSKLIHAAEIEPLQREMNIKVESNRFDWAVNVIKNDQVNAFCLPGGMMVVFSGIIPVAENDDQLATVLAHEMAHALAHHASERVARDQSGVLSYLRNKAYDRAQESEADKIGVFLMTFANYDPREAIRFWQRMEQRAGGRGESPEFLSDHPSSGHRVQDLRRVIPYASAGKKAFDEGKIAPAPGR